MSAGISCEGLGRSAPRPPCRLRNPPSLPSILRMAAPGPFCFLTVLCWYCRVRPVHGPPKLLTSKAYTLIPLPDTVPVRAVCQRSLRPRMAPANQSLSFTHTLHTHTVHPLPCSSTPYQYGCDECNASIPCAQGARPPATSPPSTMHLNPLPHRPQPTAFLVVQPTPC